MLFKLAFKFKIFNNKIIRNITKLYYKENLFFNKNQIKTSCFIYNVLSDMILSKIYIFFYNLEYSFEDL